MPDLAEVAAERVADALMPQGDLLGLPPMPTTKAEVAARAAQRRAGRPPGSRNRRMEDAARTAIEAFGEPLLRQVAVATMDAEELAARMGCTVLEAIQEQRLAAVAVLPYLHSRRPLAVDVTQRRMVHLTILDPAAPPDAASPDLVVQVMDYQGVDDGSTDEV